MILAGQLVIIDIWDDKASGPLHTIHLGYGVGSFVVTQLMEPFISSKIPSNSYLAFVSNDTNITGSSTLVVPSETLQDGFWIITALTIAISLPWFAFSLFFKHNTNTTSKRDRDGNYRLRHLVPTLNPNSCAPGHPVFVVIMYFMILIWSFVVMALERIYSKYLYSFAREQNGFTKQEAANI